MLAALSGWVCLGIAAAAMAETLNWPVPPQNTALACTGRESPDDPGAALRVQVMDQFGPYRSDQVIMVSDMTGMPVVTLACNGPLGLIRLHPGSYLVQAFVAGAVRSPEVAVNVPPAGTSVALVMSEEPNQSFDTPNID